MVTVNFNDTVSVSVTVTDSAGNTRTFNAGTQTVAAVNLLIDSIVVDDTTDPIGLDFNISRDATVYIIWTVDDPQEDVTPTDVKAGNLEDGTPAPLATGPITVTSPSQSLSVDITSLADGLVKAFIVASDDTNDSTVYTTSFTRLTATTIIAGDGNVTVDHVATSTGLNVTSGDTLVTITEAA